MKDTIENLTRLLLQSLTTANFSIGKECQQEALQNAAALQVRFMAEYHATLKKKQRVRYVKSLQLFCVQMIDQMEDWRRQYEMAPIHTKDHQSCFSFYHEVQQTLLSLLDYLEKNFGHEMDRQQKLPGYRIREARIYFQSVIEQFESKTTFADEDPGLKKVLITIIRDEISHFTLNYVQLAQWKRILSTLLAPASTLSETDPIRYLLARQFNYPQFMQYVIRQWREPIKSLETAHQIGMYWTNCMHTLDDIFFLPESPFVIGYPSCNTLLCNAIRAEMALLEPPSFSAHTNYPGNQNNKPFQTNLSVAQLAAMIRLLVETGVLDCPNQTQLLKNISQNFTTRRTQEISPESLRQKYYQRDGATVSIVRGYLMNMLQELSL